MNEAQLIILVVSVILAVFILVRKNNKARLEKNELKSILNDREQGIGVEFAQEDEKLNTISLCKVDNPTGCFENSEVVISFDLKNIFQETYAHDPRFKNKLGNGEMFKIKLGNDAEWGLKNLLNNGAHISIYSKRDNEYVNDVSYSQTTEGEINTSDDDPTLPVNKLRYYLPNGKLFYRSTEHEYEWLEAPSINYLPNDGGQKPQQKKWGHIAMKIKR